MTQSTTHRLLLLVGLSGAGHTTALRALEDSGWQVVDNLPFFLLDTLFQQENGLPANLALGLGTRVQDFSVSRLLAHVASLKKRTDIVLSLVFLDCQDDVLQRRYTETRRPHPLAPDRPVADGIAQERALLAPLKNLADMVVDTSDLTVHDTRRLVAGHFGIKAQQSLLVSALSFSFRHGVPREADLVFDVRFLSNPYYDPALRGLTGQDEAVKAHVMADPAFGGFMENMIQLLEPLLPLYEQEGKSYLTIAIGCTGGQHRSVCVAEMLAGHLRHNGRFVDVRHRELEKRA